MAVCWDLPTASGEQARMYGQKKGGGRVQTKRPPLLPGVAAGGHDGSHDHLTAEFVDALLRDRKPWIDVAQPLNMTIAGLAAHQSALNDGKTTMFQQWAAHRLDPRRSSQLREGNRARHSRNRRWAETHRPPATSLGGRFTQPPSPIGAMPD